MNGDDRTPDEPPDGFAGIVGDDVRPLTERPRTVRRTARRPGGPRHEPRPEREPFVHPDDDAPRLAHRPEVSPKRVERLRSGALQPDRKIDFHGMRADAAQQALARGIESASRAGQSVVLVIHGRGKHSGGMAVLRDALPEWLEANDRVLAFAPAPGTQAAAGSTLVLLRQRSR